MRDIAVKVGFRIRHLRRRRSLTQEQTAEAAGIHPAYYGRIERGETNVSIERLAAVARVLDVSAAFLLDVDLSLDNPESLRGEIIESLGRLNVKHLKAFATLLADIGNEPAA
jgi:transcriptional regulator with XRE-family HTH domain